MMRLCVASYTLSSRRVHPALHFTATITTCDGDGIGEGPRGQRTHGTVYRKSPYPRRLDTFDHKVVGSLAPSSGIHRLWAELRFRRRALTLFPLPRSSSRIL